VGRSPLSFLDPSRQVMSSGLIIYGDLRELRRRWLRDACARPLLDGCLAGHALTVFIVQQSCSFIISDETG